MKSERCTVTLSFSERSLGDNSASAANDVTTEAAAIASGAGGEAG